MSYHIPVLLEESVNGLNIKPNGIYVDLTFGGGGHSKKILEKLDNGKLFGFDQDADAKKNIINDNRFVFVHHNFKFFKNFLKFYNVDKVDGILADLGLSSHHINNPDRGFSFRFDAELDMRMNRESLKTAKDVINNYTQEQLSNMFFKYGELRNSNKISKVIMKCRDNKQISTTFDLVNALKSVAPYKTENKFYAQVFQAIRIEVNNEINVLKDMLIQTLETLKPNGRISVITYHSLEDRLVKNFFRSGNIDGKIEKDFYGNIKSPFKLINKKVITANENEIKQNNRARSAKLRIAEKN